MAQGSQALRHPPSHHYRLPALPYLVLFRNDGRGMKLHLKVGPSGMDAGFESQWDAAWFRERAEQCFRLAKCTTQSVDADALRTFGHELEAQAILAQDLQDAARGRKASPA